MRIGLFGGSFNPVHVGHLIASRSVAERLHLDKVYLIPAAVPPHRMLKNLAPAEHRLAMLQLAVQDDPLFEVSDIELRRSGPSYTVHTVEEFRRQLGADVDLFWLIGADSLADLPNWYQADRLVDLCRIVTAARPGCDHIDTSVLASRFTPEQSDRLLAGILDTPRIDISASEIRRRVSQGRSIRFLVPDAVAQYITEHRLYLTERVG